MTPAYDAANNDESWREASGASAEPSSADAQLFTRETTMTFDALLFLAATKDRVLELGPDLDCRSNLISLINSIIEKPEYDDGSQITIGGTL